MSRKTGLVMRTGGRGTYGTRRAVLVARPSTRSPSEDDGAGPRVDEPVHGSLCSRSEKIMAKGHRLADYLRYVDKRAVDVIEGHPLH